jgi:Cu+-exporting ATPase
VRARPGDADVDHGGDGRGATAGVLFKNAEAIEVLRSVDTLVVDKTGTLTRASRRWRGGAADGWTSGAAARGRALERGSEHPLAAAIVEGAGARGVRSDRPTRSSRARARAWSGAWTAGRVRSATCAARGARRAAGEAAARAEAMRARADGDVRRRRRRAGRLVSVADPIKDTTPDAIRQLHAEGVRIVMLTGDSRRTAEAVARRLGIDEVIAEVLPDQKAAVVERLQREGARGGDGRRLASTTRRPWRRRKWASRWARH